MPHELAASGLGVISAVAQGAAAFSTALLEGQHAFAVMQRPGRQCGSASFLGAEIGTLTLPAAMDKRVLRGASLTAQAALIVLHEAWQDAKLSEVEPQRIGLVIGGSNVQQREAVQLHDAYRERPQFLRPSYGLSFMDSDLCGFCTQLFDIRGLACTVGGASASGQMAILMAAQLVSTRQVDVCIALGALMDLSYWECQGLRALGAMGSDRFAGEPALACRPFDRDHDGFIFGECSGAVVIERLESARRRNLAPYAVLSGWGTAIDGNRNPDPSLPGEVRSIQDALQMAEITASGIDYVNPHGTGSSLGDTTELQALRSCKLTGAYLNATKSLIGHGLSAAGTVEVIATLLQMRSRRLHPTRNLDQPLDSTLNWVRSEPIAHRIDQALTLSMGFGGINTALCWRRAD
jgi:malonyl-ACP decarboxylase